MLPSEAVYALSLTSKTMSCFFDRQQLLLKDPLAKKRFLLCIESHKPGFLLCYTCDRLYQWTFQERRNHACVLVEIPFRITIMVAWTLSSTTDVFHAK